MDTIITSKNPFEHDRYGFSWEHISSNSEAHFDFGCNKGVFLNSLKSKGLDRLVGVDISSEAIAQAQLQYPSLEIKHIQKATPLPFENGQFTSITIMAVIEHVYEQKELLDELNRVLKDDGILIITVPGKYLFSFLDLGNYKFLFPRLHRWYYCLTHSKQEYESRYISNPDGLIGDISARKKWHEHFSHSDLQKLVNNSNLKVDKFDGAGFFFRILIVLNLLFKWLKPLDSFLAKLKKADLKYFKSTELFCVCRKQ